MAEKLKVFKDVVNQTTSGDYDIVANDATTQAVINEVQYSVTGDTLVDTELVFKAGNKVLDTTTIGVNETYKAQFVSDIVKEIIDVSSSLTLSLTQPETAYELPVINMLVFETANGLMLDSFAGTRNDHTDYEYATLTSTLSANATTDNTSISSNSAFTVDITDVTYFCQNYTGTVKRFDSAGALIQTYPVFTTAGTNVYGVCSDDTYIYGLSTGAASILQRINIATGLVDTDITLSQAVDPQVSTGSFTLYYNGYVYTKNNGNSSSIYKIDVVTGAVTVITLGAEIQVGTSAGARITVDIYGVPYIVEYGTGAWYKFNLLDNTSTKVTHTSNVAVNYGNASFELASGVVGFLYTSNIYFVDINTDTSTIQLTSSTYNFPTVSNTCAIAQKPIHEYTGLTPVTKSLSYDVYASGVEITGV